MLASLAFCNDTDFADWRTYQEVHRILREEFGLPAEDSCWLFDPEGSDMALFRRALDEKGPRHEELLGELRSGRLTVLHGAGNFSRVHTRSPISRNLVADALAYVRQHASVPRIWTNHGDEGDASNIGGAAPTYHQGDNPSSDLYVLDLLLRHDVRFFWTDHHATNDFVCSAAGSLGRPLLVTEQTRAGYPIRCFYRYRGALPKAPDAQTLGRQLTRPHLDALVEASGVTVLYQHWGVHRDPDGRPRTAGRPVFPFESLAGLKLLQQYRDRNFIRVLPLSQLLDEIDRLSAEHVAGEYHRT